MVRFFDGADSLVAAAKSAQGSRRISQRLAFPAMLPPGAFIGLGLMLAKHLIDFVSKKRRAEIARLPLFRQVKQESLMNKAC